MFFTFFLSTFVLLLGVVQARGNYHCLQDYVILRVSKKTYIFTTRKYTHLPSKTVKWVFLIHSNTF